MPTKIGSQTLKQLYEVSRWITFMERWKIGIYICSVCAEPWKDSHALTMQNCFFVCYSLIGFVMFAFRAQSFVGLSLG